MLPSVKPRRGVGEILATLARPSIILPPLERAARAAEETLARNYFDIMNRILFVIIPRWPSIVPGPRSYLLLI